MCDLEIKNWISLIGHQVPSPSNITDFATWDSFWERLLIRWNLPDGERRQHPKWTFGNMANPDPGCPQPGLISNPSKCFFLVLEWGALTVCTFTCSVLFLGRSKPIAEEPNPARLGSHRACLSDKRLRSRIIANLRFTVGTATPGPRLTACLKPIPFLGEDAHLSLLSSHPRLEPCPRTGFSVELGP